MPAFGRAGVSNPEVWEWGSSRSWTRIRRESCLYLGVPAARQSQNVDVLTGGAGHSLLSSRDRCCRMPCAPQYRKRFTDKQGSHDERADRLSLTGEMPIGRSGVRGNAPAADSRVGVWCGAARHLGRARLLYGRAVEGLVVPTTLVVCAVGMGGTTMNWRGPTGNTVATPPRVPRFRHAVRVAVCWDARSARRNHRAAAHGFGPWGLAANNPHLFSRGYVQVGSKPKRCFDSWA